MNHCGQSRRFVLLREDDSQDVLDRGVVLEREQELDRALADVARAPGGAADCSRPCGTVRCTMAFCASQGRTVLTAATPSPAPLRRKSRVTCCQYAPPTRGSPASSTPRGVFRRERLGRLRIGQRPDDGEGERVVRRVRSATIGAAARLAVDVEQLVAADRLDRIRRAADEVVDGVRIALAPERGRVGAEGDPPGVGVDLDPPGMVELALAEDEAAEDQEPAGRALDGDAPLHRRVVARRHRADA